MTEQSDRIIRIGGGQGFYGDTSDAIRAQLADGIDYLCLEGLAELTMAILQKDRQRDETLGYLRDLPAFLTTALPYVAEGRTKVISNAGGINPIAAGRATVAVAEQLGLRGLRIATVVGDDLTRRAEELGAAGFLGNVDTGADWSDFPGDPLFLSAYLGAAPIVEALRQGADVVITGRVADPSLFLAPLVHEFGWAADDWDRLSAGTVVGHLCECTGQSTGGNFAGEWWTIPDPWEFGYPIAECRADGTAVLTKAPGTGGRVDVDTVRHQLLYEVHDPARYLTPDVVADFTSVELTDQGADRVAVTGVRGSAATGSYRVLACHAAGFASEGRVAFSWPDAYAKARATAEIFRRRVERAGLTVEEWSVEYWGVNALHGPTVPMEGADEVAEVALRVSWRCADRKIAARVGRELVPLGLSAPPPGLTASGRSLMSPPSELLGLWPTLVPMSTIDAGVVVDVTTV